jgi:hypothetical protein
MMRRFFAFVGISKELPFLGCSIFLPLLALVKSFPSSVAALVGMQGGQVAKRTNKYSRVQIYFLNAIRKSCWYSSTAWLCCIPTTATLQEHNEILWKVCVKFEIS